MRTKRDEWNKIVVIYKSGVAAMKFDIISAKELDDYVNSPNTLIIDLRDKEAYDAYHVPKAVNIPFEELEGQQYSLSEYYQIVLYCERGSQSLLAARRLCRLGYRVRNVCGGIHAYLENKKMS
jgi:rhodanese-related sulfurtransferase